MTFKQTKFFKERYLFFNFGEANLNITIETKIFANRSKW